MNNRMSNVVLLLVLSGALFGGAAYGQFTPGHVFVSIEEFDPCEFGGLEVIVEIDPSTGASSIFADSSDGLCMVSGLRFTPDHQRLLALNFGRLLPPRNLGFVQSFAADGTSTVILDDSDGLVRPFGANALAFNSDGDLFVLSQAGILRFPADGGAPTVFSTLWGQGALDFAPNGDLFAAGGIIVRITPNGVSSAFDDPPGTATSLAFDSEGNLFVGSSGNIFRYDNGDAGSRRLLATGFFSSAGSPMPITLSADGSLVYFLERGGALYSIDAENGITTVVADISNLPVDIQTPAGITVNSAPPGPVPAVSEWALVTMTLVLLTAGTLLLRRRKLYHILPPGFNQGDKL